MTIEGAIVELQSWIDSEEIPFWAKPSLKKIKETVEDEREECIALQDKQIVWHPYPKEKPTEHEEYLVTVYLPIWHERIVCVDNYGWNKWLDNENDVIAWAELPKPYEEGAEGEEGSETE